MERNDSSAAISSLASTYADDSASGSDQEPDEKREPDHIDNISGSDDEASNLEAKRKASPEKEEVAAKVPKLEYRPRTATRLVSYGPDDHEEDEKDVSHESVTVEEEHESSPEEPWSSEQILAVSMDSNAPSKSLPEMARDMDPGDIKLPPEPPYKCSKKLQEKIRNFNERMVKQGSDLNASIQRRKDFRNPSIYEKLITFCRIDEKGTNFPPEIYNPRIWGKESYYDELARAQKVEMDKREKERKERTKVEFVTGTKKASEGSSSGEKRKSKWDSQPAPVVMPKPVVITTTSTNIPVVSLTTSASGTKTTVISAVGTLSKKPK